MAFQAVAGLDSLGLGTAIAVEVGGVPVAVVRTDDGTVKAVHNVCSHEQYELAPEGFVDDDQIECALHGSTFDLDTGEPLALPAVKAVPVYACEVEGGDVYVDVTQQLNDAPAPRH